MLRRLQYSNTPTLHYSSEVLSVPTVRLIPEEEATGVVKEVYEDIKRTKGIDRVPNFWRALASSPPLLEQVWTELKCVMSPGKLDVLTKEMIALAVSITNSCDY